MMPSFSMMHIFNLLLPVVIPSWRFFDVIAPSPRVEYALLRCVDQKIIDWKEYSSDISTISFGVMLWRMVWNAQRNNELFVVSCAERLIEQPNAHSCDEIAHRIYAGLSPVDCDREENLYLQFRLAFVRREGDVLHRDVEYVSPLYSLNELAS